MPLDVDFEDLPFELRGSAPAPMPTEDIDWGDSWDSSWTTEAPAGAIWDMSTVDRPPLNPEEQDVYDKGLFNASDAVFEHHPDLDDPLLLPYLQDARSLNQLSHDADNLREEIEARRIAREAPGMQQFITDVGVSIVASPVTYGEIGAAVATRYVPILAAGSIAVRGARRAAQFGGWAFAGTAIDEFILHQNQKLRTKTETVAAGVGALGLGGAFGYATGAGRVIKLNPDLSADVSKLVPPVSAQQGPKPGGAAVRLDDISQSDYNAIMDSDMSSAQKTLAVIEKQGENYEVVGGLMGIGKGAAKLAAWTHISPEIAGAVSKSATVRRFNAFITNNPMLNRQQQMGEGYTNLDAVARRGDTDVEVNVSRIFDEAYTAHKKDGGRLTRLEHDMELQLAVTRGIKSEYESASIGAGKLHAGYLEGVGRRGVTGKFLNGTEDGTPVKPLGDQLWYLRAYSRGFAMRTSPEKYADDLVPLYLNNLRKLAGEEKAVIEAKITKLREDLKLKGEKPDKKTLASLRRKNPKGRELERLVKDDTKIRREFMGMRNDIVKGNDTMQNSEYSGTGMKVEADGTVTPFTQGRTIDMPTEAFPRDYLDPDPMMSIINSLKRMNRQLLVVEDSRFGDATFSNWRAERLKEHNARIGVIEEAGGDVKATKKLETQYNKDVEFMNKMVQAYYNIRPGTASEMTRTVFANIKATNALTGLGSVLFTTIPELGAALSHNGVRGYVNLATAWLSDPKAMAKMTRLEKEWMDIGIQTNLGMRIAEKGEYSSGMGAASRALHKTADYAVDKVYMLGVWTRAVSAQAAAMTQFKLVNLMSKKTLSKRDLGDLGRLGIRKDQFASIRKEINTHKEKISLNSYNPHMEKWDNQALAQNVINAVNAEVDNIIIRPGVGATPFIGRTLGGSVALQFKQFLMAATSKYLIADIQRVAIGDWRAIERQLAFLALGYTSTTLKNNYLYGETAKKRWAEKSFGGQMVDSLANGGGTGIGTDVLNTMVEMVNPGSGSSRFYGQRSWQSMVLGPTAGKAVEELPVMAGIIGSGLGADRKYTKSDAKTLWRNLPGNSFWPVRLGFTQTTGKGGHEMLYEVTK